MPADPHAYVVRRACGCAVALAVDSAENADDLARWLRQGLTLHHVTIPEARATSLGCPHTPFARQEEAPRG